jgi:methylenetetrahydrofolate reductase (NADPH)
MLNTVYGPDRFGLSFELFPPKTESGDRALFQHVEQLTQFRPSYITCTYGAGGSTRDKTLDVVDRVKQQFQVPVASHLTCVGATREDLRGYLIEAQRRGVDAIVALRGDPPEGQEHFEPVPGGLRYANELVELIRGEFPQFSIAVAGYPETHQEAISPEADLDNLKRKVEAGADVVITQLFYQQDDFFRFRDRYHQAGIEAPLVPGILPVTNLAQIKRITALCGARLPAPFVQRLSEQEDPEWQFQVGVDFATEQVQALLEGEVPGVHFYVLNKSQATSQVLQRVELPSAGDA